LVVSAPSVHARVEKVVDEDVVLLALVAALDAAGGNLVNARVGGDHLSKGFSKFERDTNIAVEQRMIRNISDGK
jgi:hypothetical protein